MAVYMIDYENVKTGGLNGISRLTDADRVIIFYSENANRLTFDLHQRLMASTAKIEYREVSVGGHNALDFQLVTYLGFLIAQEPDGQYLIISNDRGFEYVVNFWRKDGLSIGLLPYLKDPNYALQKAMRPEGKPVANSVVSEEPAEEPAPEPEVIFEAAEEAKPEEQAPETAIPEEPAPAPEVVLEEIASEAAPAMEETFVAPAELPMENAEKPKPSRKKKQSAPKKQEKQAEKPAAKPLQAKEEPQRPADRTEEADKADEPTKPAETLSAETRAELRAMLGDSVADDPELRFVLGCVEKYKTKLGLNNALVKRFGNQKASEIYQKLKPLLSAKKTAEPAPKQKNAPKPKKEKAAVS